MGGYIILACLRVVDKFKFLLNYAMNFGKMYLTFRMRFTLIKYILYNSNSYKNRPWNARASFKHIDEIWDDILFKNGFDFGLHHVLLFFFFRYTWRCNRYRIIKWYRFIFKWSSRLRSPISSHKVVRCTEERSSLPIHKIAG